jgi:peptidoglycan/xylan/chitin deacetylase (PgdA/CDA1 family)
MYQDLCGLIRPLGANDRAAVFDQLRNWAQYDGTARTTHRALTALELIELARSPGVEIGGHTHQHSLLSALALDEQRREIDNGKAQLEGILGAPIQSFAYPFGGETDYTRDTARLVSEAGFKSACANRFGWIRNPSDVFRLPRFLIRNWSAFEFEKRLAKCRFA